MISLLSACSTLSTSSSYFSLNSFTVIFRITVFIPVNWISRSRFKRSAQSLALILIFWMRASTVNGKINKCPYIPSASKSSKISFRRSGSIRSRFLEREPGSLFDENELAFGVETSSEILLLWLLGVEGSLLVDIVY